MRSMYVSMLALALTVLLCACVSNVPVWETVDDAQVCQGESRLPSTIVFAVPEGAAVQTFSASGAAQSCSAQDGSYEITATVLTEDDPESAIRALTGFDADSAFLCRNISSHGAPQQAKESGCTARRCSAMSGTATRCAFPFPRAPAQAMIAYRNQSLQALGCIMMKCSEIRRKPNFLSFLKFVLLF